MFLKNEKGYRRAEADIELNSKSITKPGAQLVMGGKREIFFAPPKKFLGGGGKKNVYHT